MDAEAFRADDRCEIVDRIVRPGFFVDDEVVEGSDGSEFFVGGCQAARDSFVGLGMARGEPRCQSGEPVRDGEDQNGFFEMGFDCEGAVDFGFGHDIVAVTELLLDKSARRSVEILVILAPLEKTVVLPAPRELAPIEEKIVDTIDFTGARGASGRGNALDQSFLTRQQLAEECVFSRSRGTREHEKQTRPGQNVPPSTKYLPTRYGQTLGIHKNREEPLP